LKYITIAIPTRNRLDKLIRLVNSIPKEDYISVIVCCDDDDETYRELNKTNPGIDVLLRSDGHIGCAACHNVMGGFATDGLMYLTDDTELYPDTIKNALAEYNEYFPDDDGMMGIPQDRIASGNSATALLGKNFLSRFTDNQFSYPGYWHFSDMEVLALAEKLGKFQLSKTARVIHYHPDDLVTPKDQTHFDARIRKGEDFDLFRDRQKAGLIWGFDKETK